MPKILTRILIIGGITIAIFFGTVTLLTYLYKDSVGQMVIERLNKHFQAKFTVESFNLSIYTKFPQLSLTLYQPQIQSSVKDNSLLFARAENVHLTINVISIFSKAYTVENIYIENADIQFGIDKKLYSNYENIMSLKSESEQNVNFDLANIFLKNTRFSYENQANKEIHSFLFDNAQLNLNDASENFKGNFSGEIKNFNSIVKTKKIMQYDLLSFNTDIDYESESQRVNLSDMNIKIKESEFLADGFYIFKANTEALMDFKFRGKNNDLKAVIAFLPDDLYEKLIDYKAEGKVDFTGVMQGEWTKNRFPHIEIDFGCKNIAIRSPNISQAIEETSFQGRFNNGEQNSLESASLKVQDIQGKLSGQKFRAGFYIKDLLNPFISINVEAGIDLASFIAFYPVDQLEKAEGFLGLELNMEGDLINLRQGSTSGMVKTSGNIELKKVSFKLKENPFLFNEVNASLLLKDNLTTVNEMSAKVGKSDFRLVDGKMTDLIAYLFVENAKLKMDGKIVSQKIHLEELLSKKPEANTDDEDKKDKGNYYFKIPDNLIFSLNIKSDSLIFRKFKVRNLNTDMTLIDQIAKTNQFKVDIAGGTMSLIGILNGQKEDFVRFDGRVIFDKVYSERILSIFENFSQRFIRSGNISGLLSADVETGLVFNNSLTMNVPNLVFAIGLRISQGEFKSFDALQRVSSTLKTKKIQLNPNLKFTELKSIIQMRNKTIFIPEMEIISPEVTLSVIGRSSLDKAIDYRVKLPFNPAFKSPSFANLSQAELAKIAFYIALKGNLDDFTPRFVEFADIKGLEGNWEKEKKQLLNMFNNPITPK